ncbi:uncharacterized protein M8220_005461 isoform 1-T4 [Acridotheres tristis]
MLSFIGGLCVFRVDNQEDADFSCTAGAAEIQAEMHHSVFICVSRDTQVALLDRKILTKGGKITIFGLSGRQQIVCYSNHQSSKFPWSMDKSSNSLPLNSNEGKGEFQIQKDSDIGTQCLAHKGRMNFHLDCFCCHDLVVDVTVGSILHCLQTHQEETVESKQIWNSFLADHSLFWDKNHGRILENRSLIW